MAEPAQRLAARVTRKEKKRLLEHRGIAFLAVAALVVCGAIIGRVSWSAVETKVVINDLGPLVRTGWRVDPSSLLTGAWAICGILSMIQFGRSAKAHAEELREVAKTLRLAYEEGEVKDSRGQHPGAPLFERWVLCENRLSGTVDGALAAMFDLMTIEGTGDGETRRNWTVILFSESRLPFFLCVPRRWTTGRERATLTPLNFDPRAMDEKTRQTVTAFEKIYVLGLTDTVSASGEDKIRQHFCAPRLEAIAQYPNWHVQSAGGFLVLALSWTAPAADRPELWHEALELRRALLAPLAPEVTAIPAAPGMDVGSQRDRRAGRRSGCLAGAFLGAFGSFIAFSAFMATRMGPGANHLQPSALHWMPFCYFGIILGGLVFGAFVGSWLGGRVADLRHSPASGIGPVPRISKGWVGAGAILGWIVGGAVGMGLTALFRREFQGDWLTPILFFTPAVLLLVVGGFAGLNIARRQAAQRMGK
jgi:hypothetical protein